MNKLNKIFISLVCGVALSLATCSCAWAGTHTQAQAAKARTGSTETKNQSGHTTSPDSELSTDEATNTDEVANSDEAVTITIGQDGIGAELNITIGDESTKATSEVVAVEVISDQVPTNIALGDDWCYLRFNLTKDQLERIEQTTADYPDKRSIALSLPECTPENDVFYINITQDDIVESLKLFEKYPDQKSVNLIKNLPIAALDSLEKPEPNMHFVYYLLTENDVDRMLSDLETHNSNALFIRQRLRVDDDNIAEFKVSSLVLQQCLEVFELSEQPYVVYICSVAAPTVI